MEYKLPSYFQSINKLEKETFLTKHAKEFSYRHSIKHIELIDLINKFRKKNNIPQLKYNLESKIPDFIIKEQYEMKIFKYKHFFQLSNKKYLFKYPINEFKKKFENKEQIVNILLLENLNQIMIIEKDDFEYVLIYKKLFKYK